MTLNALIDRAAVVFLVALAGVIFETIILGGGAPFLFLLSAIIGGFALQVLLLAIIANAMVNTLKKKEQ